MSFPLRFEVLSMKRIYSIPVLLLSLTGCQSTQDSRQPIPENILQNLSTQWVVVESCYNSGAYTVEQAVNYRDAINYSFSTWSVEQVKIDKTVGEQRTAINDYQSTNGGLGTTCKNWHLNMETTVKNVNNHKHQMTVNQQRAHEINKAKASKPVTYSTSQDSSNNNIIQCTKLGDLSFNKNIQTFKGMVCPIGWLPYNGW